VSGPDRRPQTAVVVAGLAAAGEGWVLRQIAALAAAGLPVGSPPRHRPHLSLSAVRLAEDELDRLVAVVDAVAVELPSVDLRLEHVGIFPSGGVLWLGPRPEPLLLELQARMDGALADAGWRRAFDQHHHPDRWVPHLTLASRLPPPALGQAVTLISTAVHQAHPHTLAVRIDHLAVILVGGSTERATIPLT
jgi:2'-5' RNA ligase